MSDKTNDDAHMTPFLQALYDCVKAHGPEDDREVLSSAIVAYNAVLAMHSVHDTSGDEDIIWMNNSVIGEA